MIIMKIEGMMCMHCHARVTKALNAFEGVNAEVDLEKGEAKIEISGNVTVDALKQAVIDELGEENVTFDLQNAANDVAMCKTITDTFASKNVDLIMANATPALQVAANASWGASWQIPTL